MAPEIPLDISIITVRGTAQHGTQEERLESMAGATPSNIQHSVTATKDMVLGRFERELLDRRWSSCNLVNHTFGEIVSISLAARILLCFLHCGILVVKLDGAVLEADHWPEACTHAASCAELASLSVKVESGTEGYLKMNYTWEWMAELGTDTEHDADNFFNVVGIAAYLAAGTVAPESLADRRPGVRFTTLPDPHHDLPLSNSLHGQDCRPDFFALPLSAFVSDAERDDRPEEHLEKPSTLAFINSHFPKLLRPYGQLLSVAGVPALEKDGPSLLTKPGAPSPASMLPQKVEDSLITEIFEEAPSASDDTREGVESATDLLEALRALGDTLKSGDHSPPPLWIENAAREYLERSFLDLSRVCFPNVVLLGECKQTDMMASVVQCTGYMCQQRRTQPWLRFGLGLVATKEQLGLLRADAVGLEECTFKKTTGRGVIETVRLVLGIMLATEQEQGVHPSFGFREKEVPSVMDSDVMTGSDRSGSSRGEPPRKRSRTDAGSSVSVPKPAKYRYKEVNFITLNHQPRTFSREPPLPAKSRTRCYVKYLLQDHGSLVGRCTRIWCVYREVLDADKSKLITLHNIPATTPVCVGPYALKFYYADVRSEAYKHDILGVAVAKKVEHVLLPTHVWYTGRVLETLRGLKSGEVPKGLKKTDLKDREEIMMITPFKRTLAQFATAGEFYRALIGALKGIQSLEKAGIIHGDISMGNIVLNSEDYPASQPAVNYINVDGTSAAFVRRDFVDLGADGGLHDLDMAAFIPADVPIEPRESISKLREAVARPRSMPPPPAPLLPPNPERSSNLAFRTGTTPFMSIPVLTGGHNSVYDDMQSLFFVHYLSLFSFDTPAPNCYPEAPTTRIPPWPAKCNEWAAGQGMKMSTLGGSKKVFFQDPKDPWSTTAKLQCLEFWKDNSTGQLDVGHYLVLNVFWDELWEYVGDDHARVRRSTATISKVLEKLENEVEYVMKNRSLDVMPV